MWRRFDIRLASYSSQRWIILCANINALLHLYSHTIALLVIKHMSMFDTITLVYIRKMISLPLYKSSVLQTWHQKCSSQKKPNNAHSVVIVETQRNSNSPFLSKTKYPHFQPLKVWPRVLFGTDMVAILSQSFIIRLAEVDGPWLRQKLGIVVFIKTGPAVKLLSWQQYNRCHFVSFVINISGAKSEKHRFNISIDIRYSVFHDFSCKPYDVITLIICIIQKSRKNEKRFSKKENAILIFFFKKKPFK